jgi:hypothetical protein
MSDAYDGMRERIRELLSDALAEQGERLKEELAASMPSARRKFESGLLSTR